MQRSALMLAAGVAFNLVGLPAAFAQTTSSTANTGSVELEEIVITAQRRVEDIQKTAIPITAISGAEIAAKGQTQVDEVLRDAPSVQIQSSPQGADIVIRGIGGNDTGGISQDPTVSVFTDGIYSGLGAATLAGLYDVQRVEVLRGPQGTLYGRNSSGGAVNILSNDPGKEFGFGVNVNVGNLNARHMDAFVNLPAGDTFAFRIAADREQRDGYYSNGGGEVDNTGVRLKGKWTPSDAFSLLARVDYWRQRGLTGTTAPVKGIDPAGSCEGPFPGFCALFASANPHNPWDTSVAAGSPFMVNPNYNDNKFYTYSLQADADLGFGTLTLIPSYTYSTQDQSSASIFAPSTPPFTISTTINKQFTYEARLASSSASSLKWVVGAYYLKNDADQSGAVGGVNEDFYAQQSDNKRPSTSLAGFAQATLPVTDALRVTAGGRYTVDEKKILYGVCSSTDGITCGPSATGAGTYISPATEEKNRYSSFTYKAGLEYDVAADVMGYAQVSTGYKAGGYSTATTPPSSYLPEKLTNFEVGIKSRLLDNRLELNADVYFYQYKDQQLELHISDPWTGIIPDQYVPDEWKPGGAKAVAQGPRTTIVDVNAGNSRYKGAEAQAKYQFTAYDQVSVQVAYNRATYGRFLFLTSGGNPPGTGCSATQCPPDSAGNQYFDLTGKQEAHAPLWSGNVGYQHVWDIGSAGTITLQGNMRLQSKTVTTIQQWFADNNTTQRGYHQSDANLRYAAAEDKWSVGLWVKNIENNAIVSYVYPLYKETLDISRTYGVSASYKF